MQTPSSTLGSGTLVEAATRLAILTRGRPQMSASHPTVGYASVIALPNRGPGNQRGSGWKRHRQRVRGRAHLELLLVGSL
jgi:hypothetical protein